MMPKTTTTVGGGAGGGGGGGGGYSGGGDAGGGGSGGGEGLRRNKRKRLLDQPRNFEAAMRTKARAVDQPAGNTEGGQAGDIANMVIALWMQNAKSRPHQSHTLSRWTVLEIKSEHGLNLQSSL